MKKLTEFIKDKTITPDVSIKKNFSRIKRPEDLEMDKLFENINKYEDINLNDVNNSIDEIKKKYQNG